jgi:hypothetical protein
VVVLYVGEILQVEGGGRERCEVLEAYLEAWVAERGFLAE